MNDPLQIVDNWPSFGHGNHSEVTKRHHEWIRSISITVKALQLRAEIVKLKNNSSSNINSPFSYSSIAADCSKKSEAEIFILSKVHAELKEKSKIENNIIISGLEEPDADSSENATEKEKEIVEDLLIKLDVNKNKVKRFTKLRRKNGKSEKNKPDLLLIEFSDNQSQIKALNGAANLRDSYKYFYL